MSETPAVDKRSWWDRNWAWFVPVGCIGGAILCVGAVVAVVAVLLWFVLGSLKSSEVFGGAIERAITNPEVVRELGEPIEQGWWVTGSMNLDGASGEADFAIPIHGPRGSGTIYVIGEKRAGKWTFELLEVEINGREDRIDLLEDDGEGEQVWRLLRNPT